MTMPTRRATLAGLGLLLAAACSSRPSLPVSGPVSATFEPETFQAWTSEAPRYRLFPGDEVDVTVHTAPELSGTVRIGPDGRVNLPLAGAVMVTEQTAPEAARRIADRYAQVLRDPIVEVRPITFGTQQILVGGEVRTPGIYEMPSPRIGVLEAVTLAGGVSNRARSRQLVVLRRSETGGVMMRTVDLRAAQSGMAADTIPLARHDIVFAPRNTIAEVNDFVELYVRNIIPIDNAFAYALADRLFNDN